MDTKRSWWKKLFKYFKPLVRLWKKYLVYVGIVLLVLVGACLSLFYIRFAANGCFEYIPLIGYIGVDEDPFRTAGVIFGAYLLIISMGLVIVRIRRTDRQIAGTEKSNDLAKSHHGITNDLAKLHHGITMLHAGNAITQVGGVEYLHRLAEKAKENKQQQEEVLLVFCAFLKYVPSSKEDGPRQAKDMILRKMFINKGDRGIYPNENINLQRAKLPGAHLREAHLQKADLMEAHLYGAHLHGAHLHGAHLEGAHLEGALLARARLREARLAFAHLHYAFISEGEREHIEHIKSAEGTDDVIWVFPSDTSYEWRGDMYNEQELKEALENHLSDLQDKFLCDVVKSVIYHLSKEVP